MSAPPHICYANKMTLHGTICHTLIYGALPFILQLQLHYITLHITLHYITYYLNRNSDCYMANSLNSSFDWQGSGKKQISQLSIASPEISLNHGNPHDKNQHLTKSPRLIPEIQLWGLYWYGTHPTAGFGCSNHTMCSGIYSNSKKSSASIDCMLWVAVTYFR